MNRRLIAALAPPPNWSAEPRVPGVPAAPMPAALLLDLVAAVVQGGAPPQAALQFVAGALREVGDDRGTELLRAAGRIAGRAPGDLPGVAGAPGGGSRTGPDRLLTVVEEALQLAARSGLPPTALVQRAAVEERRRQLSVQLQAIRRLEVLLVIPAGLCLLPAFVLLGIVPLVIKLIGG